MEQKSIKHIVKKLHTIMSEVGIIEKDKTNDFHKYEYASEFAIKKALHPLLVKHGVLFTVGVTKVYNEIMNDAKGQSIVSLIDVAWVFTDVDTGEQFSGTFAGCGADKGDKGLYKAITGAIKYILTSTFLIPTGDDPENEKAPKKDTIKPGGILAQDKPPTLDED